MEEELKKNSSNNIILAYIYLNKIKKNVANYFGILSLNLMLKRPGHTNRNSTPSSFSLPSPIHDEASTALRGGRGGVCGDRLGGAHAQRRLEVGGRRGRHAGLAVRRCSD